MNLNRHILAVALCLLIFTGTAAGCTPDEFDWPSDTSEESCEEQATEALWSQGSVSPVGQPYVLPSAEGVAMYLEIQQDCGAMSPQAR